jgi:ribosomal protein S3
MAAQISKKRKFVADGVFRAELNEFFTRELAEEGYSGCDVRVTHARTEVRSMTVHTKQSAYVRYGIDHYPCYPYTRSPWRERAPYS